jgi:putative selenium metabolism hydrolase
VAFDTAEFDVDAGRLVGFAQSLAMTPSVSGAERAAVELAAREMDRLGFDEVTIDEVGNCVGYVGQGPGPRLLIDGHIDSIPLHSEGNWTVDPFGGVIREGRLYGLGICDQKASIAAAAHGLAAARSSGRLKGRIGLVASVNEEDVEGAALSAVVDAFEPTWAITTEPSDTRLCIGQRGRAKLSVRVTGRSCHAGHSSEGVNAAEALAVLVAAVRRLDHPCHPRLGRRDITCIDVTSFPYPSVSTVPGQALARFDCRFIPGETPDSLVETIRSAANAAWESWPERPDIDISIVQAEFTTWKGGSFSLPEFEQAWWTPEGTPLVEGAQAALESVGLDPTPAHYSFCTNGSYLCGSRSIPTVGFGVGEEHVAHQVDEYVTLRSLTRGAQGFAAIACRLMATAQY